MSHINQIVQKIEEQINNSDLKDSLSKKGEILQIKDGVAIVSGLQDVKYSEIVEFENKERGLVLDLLKDEVGVLILGNQQGLSQGQIVKSTGEIFSIGVGKEYLGRVINGLGQPIDGKGEIKAKETMPVEKTAPGVIARKSVDQPLQTGIKAIDSMIPIGKGQRELIIGDRKTGKTSVAIDTIINQKTENVYCIYVAIGQKASDVARIEQTLKDKGAMDYTIIVNAPANSASVAQYMAPYIGVTLGEWFMENGMDALIVYDDLSKHAVAYREMSLLLRRPPGREAYPGDVFYQHSKLLERAARVTQEYGGGSLTALPIIETKAGDVSAYIPTNVISITDGQVFLESNLFNSGVRPAINIGTSVSRVGGSAQTKLVKKVSGKMKLFLAQYRELEAFAQFGSDLDAATKKVLDRGVRYIESLKQNVNSPVSFDKMSILFFAGEKGYFEKLAVEQVSTFENMLYAKLDGPEQKLRDMMVTEKKLTDEIKAEMKRVIEDTVEEILAE